MTDGHFDDPADQYVAQTDEDTADSAKEDDGNELVCPECGGSDIPWAINPVIEKNGFMCYNKGCKKRHQYITPIPRSEYEAKQKVCPTCKGDYITEVKDGKYYCNNVDCPRGSSSFPEAFTPETKFTDALMKVLLERGWTPPDPNNITVGRELLGEIVKSLEATWLHAALESPILKKVEKEIADLQALLDGEKGTTDDTQ